MNSWQIFVYPLREASKKVSGAVHLCKLAVCAGILRRYYILKLGHAELYVNLSFRKQISLCNNKLPPNEIPI